MSRLFLKKIEIYIYNFEIVWYTKEKEVEKMDFGEKIKRARRMKGYTQRDLAALVGAKHNSVSNWETNRNKPDTDLIRKLCAVLDVSPSFLLSDENTDIAEMNNVSNIENHKLPMLGEIACGEPIFCNQEYDSYVEVGSGIRADFALKAKGNSMINARIKDGDIVFIRRQPMVRNGEIAAVCIDNEATLKRVYVAENIVTLVAENPAYSPIVYRLDGNTNISILGKAVAFQSEL